MLFHQVSYILDITSKNTLDFKFHQGPNSWESFRLGSLYRDYIIKSFHSIDPNNYSLYKKVYDNDSRYVNEITTNFDDFSLYIPSNEGKNVQFTCVLCRTAKDQAWRFEKFPEQITTRTVMNSTQNVMPSSAKEDL